MNEQAAEYLRNAYCLAAQSRDTSNQNGATLVNSNNEIIATGNNNFPIGVGFTKERSEIRPDKYRYFEHAERSTIYQAARTGNKIFGSTLFCCWAACCDCARAIINSGVLTLVVHYERMQMTPIRWQDDVNSALAMLTESGVSTQYYKGPINVPSILVNGITWCPNQPPEIESGNWFVGMSNND